MDTVDKLQALLNPFARIKEGRGYEYLEHVERIKCASGLDMSMQTSRSHYCSPRDNRGPWFEVEIGFPSERVEKLMPYAEDAGDPTGTVYAYVPLAVVAEIVDDNGGLVSK